MAICRRMGFNCKKMTKDCSIIIPCFKTPFNLLNKCIDDIIKYWDLSKINLEIILIIDGGIKETQMTSKSI